jgi:hypothetical protein
LGFTVSPARAAELLGRTTSPALCSAIGFTGFLSGLRPILSIDFGIYINIPRAFNKPKRLSSMLPVSPPKRKHFYSFTNSKNMPDYFRKYL